ncbi:hypothetical protein EXIGLDRAFT_723821 [Exidia glandulosa HHB12029]|uniref:Uncharacterized protein n=1 Tax=Exidia glandulosa HHB12029 TaxID=1314781 RepID=A0A165EME6_EXIGL|nr:hypothetical protein EXIGLDRAFT_723821 [Exidia glandulosa HHB12029]
MDFNRESRWSRSADRILDFALIISVLLLVLPLLVWNMIRYGYYELSLRAQNFLSDTRRRRRYGNNSRNAAACLPPEVQLRIFRLLLQRGRFGLGVPTRWKQYARPDIPSRDLKSAVRVCRTWRYAAEEILYSHVILSNDMQCLLFAETLAKRPALAQLVRRYALPPSAATTAYLTPEAATSRRGRHWLPIKVAIDRIVVLCTQATDVQLWGSLCRSEHIHGLFEFTTRPTLRRLAIAERSPRDWFEQEERPQLPAVFPTPPLQQRLYFLQELHLDNCDLEPGSATCFPSLRALVLVHCSICYTWLVSVFRNAPTLQVVCWDDSETRLIDYPTTNHDNIFEGFEHRISKIMLNSTYKYETQPFLLGSMLSFTRLRSFECTGRILLSLREPPPLLEELIVTKICEHRDGLFALDPARAQLFTVVSYLRLRIPDWASGEAPFLTHVFLWDSVDIDSLVAFWTVAGYILARSLKPCNVGLRINLYLGAFELAEPVNVLATKKRMNTLLWRNFM